MPGLLPVGFPSPPSEPDVRVSAHPALHNLKPLVRSLSALYRYLQPGELLGGRLPEHAVFREFWQQARSDAFMPPAHVARLRESKAS